MTQNMIKTYTVITLLVTFVISSFSFAPDVLSAGLKNSIVSKTTAVKHVAINSTSSSGASQVKSVNTTANKLTNIRADRITKFCFAAASTFARCGGGSSSSSGSGSSSGSSSGVASSGGVIPNSVTNPGSVQDVLKLTGDERLNAQVLMSAANEAFVKLDYTGAGDVDLSLADTSVTPQQIASLEEQILANLRPAAGETTEEVEDPKVPMSLRKSYPKLDEEGKLIKKEVSAVDRLAELAPAASGQEITRVGNGNLLIIPANASAGMSYLQAAF